jgi:hypothetical protein
MSVTTVNIKQEGEKLLNLIRENNPDFNLSGFLSDKLKEHFENKSDILSISQIDKEIEILKSKQNTLFLKIEQLIEQKLELQKQEQQKIFDIEYEKQKEISRKEYKRKMVNDFFKEQFNRDITDLEYDEYTDMLEKDFVNNIFDYTEVKKLK